MNDMKHIPEASDLKEIMQVMTETVPELLEKITKVLFDSQEGNRMGSSVAAFYSALVEQGMSKDQAFELTRTYMSSASLGGMIASIGKGVG